MVRMIHALEILHVEDDADTREVVSLLLSAKGYRVTSCSSPLEALRLEREVDVVISDVIMGNATTTDVAGFLRRCFDRGSGVVLFTGAGYTDVPVGFGRAVYLRKPAELDSMDGAIRESLRRVSVTVSDEDVTRLSNPSSHMTSPLDRWLIGQYRLGREELRTIGENLQRTCIRKALREAAEQDWPKRDLDRLMEMHPDVRARFRPRGAERTISCNPRLH